MIKYFSYTLLALSLFLIFNIFLSYAFPTYREALRDIKQSFVGVEKEDVIAKMNQDQIEINTKILDSIDKLNRKIEDIETNTQPVQLSDVNNTQVVDLSSIPQTLLIKLLPDINPTSITKNTVFGIGDLNLLQKFNYSTFEDTKNKITLYVFDKDYAYMKNVFESTNIYTINSADTFFSYTFYLNSPQEENSIVRFVTVIEGMAVGFEVEKNNYDFLKNNLLNN